jgi:hypothetical protein
MKQYLIVIILLLFLYYLNNVRSESFQCELSHKVNINSKKKTENNIVVQVIQSNSDLNNYITEDFCNLRIIRYLNDIFSSTDDVFKLKKMLPVNYKNNLINSYHHVTIDEQDFKTSDEIDEFVNNDLELFDMLLKNGDNMEEILKRIINTEYLDDSTINIVFVPYLKNDIIELTLNYHENNYDIIVCGMYDVNNNYELTIPYIPSNLKKNWVSNYIVDSDYKLQDKTNATKKKKKIANLFKQKKKIINRIKKIKNHEKFKDLDKDEYYKNIKRLQTLYLTDMKDIPIINNYIKNKKSQKKLDELFNKPTGPFNSKYKWRDKWRDKTTKTDEVAKLKAEIGKLERKTNKYKKLNDKKTKQIKPLKKKLENIEKEIYNKHRLKPLDYKTELVKQQRADHNKEIYMNKMYFDKLDIILTMAIYISNIKLIDNPIPTNLFTHSSTTQPTNMDVCQLFSDDDKAIHLCKEKQQYIYGANISVPTTQLSNRPVEEDEYDTQCIDEINNENIPQHKLKYRTKTIDGVEFKIPKNQALYNRQIKDYLNSNEYYLNRFSDSYI